MSPLLRTAEPNCHMYEMPYEPAIIRRGVWTSLRSEERNRSPPQTRRPLNLLIRCQDSRIYRGYLSSCHIPTSLTEYTCSTSPTIPSAQCSLTQRTKFTKKNCAAPSTSSRVTTTPTTLTLGRRRDPSAFGSKNTVS